MKNLLMKSMAVLVVVAAMIPMSIPVYATEVTTLPETPKVEHTEQPEKPLQPEILDNSSQKPNMGNENPGTVPQSEGNGNGNSGNSSQGGGTVDSGKMQSTIDGIFSSTDNVNIDWGAGKQSLGGLNKAFSKIISLVIGAIMMWLPLTFFGDMVVGFIPKLKEPMEKIYLVSSHVGLLDGNETGRYMKWFKSRLWEFIIALTLLTLVASNTHMVVVRTAVEIIVTLVTKGIDFLTGLAGEIF